MKTISIKKATQQTAKVNQFALETTEKVVVKSIDTLSDLQQKTEHWIHKFLDFSEKQQNRGFDFLEKGKATLQNKIQKKSSKKSQK